MTLEQRINDGIKEAMKAQDEGRKRALREIKAQILLAKTDGSGIEITEEREIQILTKMAKQRKDSSEIYQRESRPELLAKEQEELRIIEEFLPQQMSAEEITAALKTIIAQVGASSPKDMGKVMGVATKQFAGVADGKVVAELVKQLLNN
jgi:uncharacterized protein